MSASVPTLLAVAHGTREPAGAPAIAALLAGVRKQLPGVIVDVAYPVFPPDRNASDMLARARAINDSARRA